VLGAPRSMDSGGRQQHGTQKHGVQPQMRAVSRSQPP